MKYTIRQTPLSRRGRANIQVMATTRDELKHLAQEHGISMGGDGRAAYQLLEHTQTTRVGLQG